MTMNRIRTVLEMIKFEHSIFALPFALTGALLAARATHQPPHGLPTLRQILWIIVAMVSARSAAMTINRIADIRYDKENPRTKQRALATGALSVSFAWIFTLVAIALFVTRCMATQSTRVEALASRVSDSVLLLVHKAIHELVALVSRLRAGNFSGSRMDRDHWRTRLAHVDPLRGSDAVGWRLRRPLRVPGHRLRSSSWIVFDPETLRNRQRIAHRPSDAHGRNRFVVLASFQLRASLAGVGWNCGRCGAAGLRTFAGESGRLEQAGRCVFHHERLY